MSHSNSCSQDTPPTDEYHSLLQRRFPRAGYWLNLLPTHPLIHGPGLLPDSGAGGDIPPLPYLPLDPALSQTSQMIQPYQFSTQMDGPVQLPSSGSAGGNGRQDNREDPVRVAVSVPLNTGVVGGPISRVQLRFPVDTGFEDFFSRICAKMDLDPKEAELGYKYHTDRARDPPHQLSNADQLLEAFERGCRLLKRGRGRDVVLEIHNLCKPSKVALPVTRRRRDEVTQMTSVQPSVKDRVQEPETSSFAAEFRKLKETLSCAKHMGKYCYVTAKGDHEAQDVYKLTSWAKSIFQQSATYDKPPESTVLSDDAPTTKRRRLSSTVTQSLPTIHVHLPSDMGQLASNRTGKLDTSLSRRYLTGPDLDECDIFTVYPSISEALTEMHGLMPLLNMPQYEDNLVSHGVAYVNTVDGISEDFFVDIVGMPLGAVRPFIAIAHHLAHRARKGKGRIANTSDSDKENEDPNSSSLYRHSPEIY